MSKFEPYNIVLKDFTGTHTVEYTLDDVFFQKIDSPEVRAKLAQAQAACVGARGKPLP